MTATAGPLSLVVTWQAPTSGDRPSTTGSSTRGIGGPVERDVRFVFADASADHRSHQGRALLRPGHRCERFREWCTRRRSPSAVPTAASRPLVPSDVWFSFARANGEAVVFVNPNYDGGMTIRKASVRCVSTNGGTTRTATATGGSPYSVLVDGLDQAQDVPVHGNAVQPSRHQPGEGRNGVRDADASGRADWCDRGEGAWQRDGEVQEVEPTEPDLELPRHVHELERRADGDRRDLGIESARASESSAGPRAGGTRAGCRRSTRSVPVHCRPPARPSPRPDRMGHGAAPRSRAAPIPTGFPRRNR